MHAPLAIIQARVGSRRLPGKVLADIAGKPLIRHVYEATATAVGAPNVVVAIPRTPENDVLYKYLDEMGAQVYAWDGNEDDVLGRFVAVARTFRWHPHTTLLRVTADDPYKDPVMMQRVLLGERLPVEIGGEAFTLQQLLDADTLTMWAQEAPGGTPREHLTHALFPKCPPPVAPPGRTWSIDTPEDLEAVRREMGAHLVIAR